LSTRPSVEGRFSTVALVSACPSDMPRDRSDSPMDAVCEVASEGRNGGLCDHAREKERGQRSGGAGGSGGADEAKAVGERNARCERQKAEAKMRRQSAHGNQRHEFNKGEIGQGEGEANRANASHTRQGVEGASASPRAQGQIVGWRSQSFPRQRHACKVNFSLWHPSFLLRGALLCTRCVRCSWRYGDKADRRLEWCSPPDSTRCAGRRPPLPALAPRASPPVSTFTIRST
jgi:hypothetical protein